MARRLTARVCGTVQGVGFRAFVVHEARRLFLSGFVRNCPGGTVEVLAEGPQESLERLEVALRTGPRGSRVTGVDSRWSAAAGEFRGFQIRY